MLLKIPILLICWFLIQPHLASKFCVRKYVNGKWITKGDCGGRERMSALQKQLKIRAADEKIKKIENRIANGKWVVFQRRKFGHVDFFRGWGDYANGFGDRDGDFWLGLESLHQLTKGGNMEMKIKMITRDGVYWVVKYSSFRIGPGSDFYRLHYSGYSGNASGSALTIYHNTWPFSTKDADHDQSSSRNCASLREGGWWHGNCYDSNLNGNFNKTGRKGIGWQGHEVSDGRFTTYPFTNLRFSEMKIRKRA